MADAWTWSYADASGAPVEGDRLTRVEFPTQADAESWLSEAWADLADAGVEAVSLWCDGELVYGPMSLSAG
ncbi:conserved hypothetical protein [Nostocoides japonicum T1-X7]|uniref:Uncharacterized protein n=1 Tax=Nostocoides japonicum T1-X7 TaxID=1194083 RepID=A0A077LVP2_9MICO|nr:hypothetical protein [Tetrasphaera japonica]CCH76887.1 conserved hypothetical protein [Tetrasphaera japonica T1-X7]